MMRLTTLKISFVLFFLCLTANGWAVTTRFTAFQVWPSVGDKHYFSISSTDPLYSRQFSLEVSNAFVYHPLVVQTAAGAVRPAVSYLIGHTVSAGIGLTNFWQLGATLPVFSVARTQDPTVTPAPGLSSAMKLGDLRVSSKVRLLDSSRTRWGVALEPFATIPIGAEEQYLGESKATAGGNLLTDFLLSPKMRMTLNVGATGRFERVVVSNIDDNHQFHTGLGFAADLTRNVAVSVESLASTTFSHFFSDKNMTPVEFLGGVQWEIGNSGLVVGAGGGTCAVCGIRGAKARGFLNIGYRFQSERIARLNEEKEQRSAARFQSKAQTVADKIVYWRENCPQNPKDFDPKQHDADCSRYYNIEQQIVELSSRSEKEVFNEVVLALQKNCPEDPAQFDPKKHDANCSKYFNLKQEIVALSRAKPQEVVLTPKESKQKFADVVLAYQKNCPEDPAQFDPEKHDAGCSKYFNLKQEIVALSTGVKPQEVVLGSKESQQKFAEVILAYQKNCPADPSKFNPEIHDPGCAKFLNLRQQIVTLSPHYEPEAVLYVQAVKKKEIVVDNEGSKEGIRLVKGQIWTQQPVAFPFNQVFVTVQGAKILSGLVEFLEAHPKIKQVEIVGHADPIGTPEAVESVSHTRAVEVIQYLRQCGLSENIKLVPLGAGAKEPVGPNETPQGRALNRRVMFYIKK